MLQGFVNVGFGGKASQIQKLTIHDAHNFGNVVSNKICLQSVDDGDATTNGSLVRKPARTESKWWE